MVVRIAQGLEGEDGVYNPWPDGAESPGLLHTGEDPGNRLFHGPPPQEPYVVSIVSLEEPICIDKEITPGKPLVPPDIIPGLPPRHGVEFIYVYRYFYAVTPG